MNTSTHSAQGFPCSPIRQLFTSIWAGISAALLVLLWLPAALANPVDLDIWYILEMSGSRAGYSQYQEVHQDNTITTNTSMYLLIKRGTLEIPISMQGSFIESPDGKPISMRSVQELGAAPVTTTVLFQDNQMIITTQQNEQTTTTTQTLPDEPWLTPAAARTTIAIALKQNQTTFKFSSIDPLSGIMPITQSFTILDQLTIKTLGKALPAYKVSSTNSLMPNITTIQFFSTDGTLIRSTVNLGGMTITTIAADKDLALSKLSPPEIMASTLVKPDKNIKNPRHTRQAQFLLSIQEGQFQLPPDTAVQRTQRVSPSSIMLTIDLDQPVEADASEDAAALLESSTMLNASDPAIKALADQALKNHAPDDIADRAEALRVFVNSYINEKSLSVGFASASQVAQTREGDCSEHACLLAAMLRADKIPARVVSGLIYVPRFGGKSNIFGYHMWAQALITIDGKPRWVDLDATLPKATPFDASHIALSTSTLNDGQVDNGLLQITPILGQLSISVQSIK